ncbi:MAG: histidinol-phosphate transaminase [Leptolyngbya sp. Prado105]|nr:histidinol-phosphate transaminase [Leptolyngbya sp. Prado105]
MLEFIRSDLAEFAAYNTRHTDHSHLVDHPLDRLDVNENPYDLPAELKQKLAWTWQNEIESNRYPDGGYLALKDAIAQYAGTFTAQNISVGNGSDELIRSILMCTCLNGEGSILVANPTFSMYGILAKTLGIPVVSVDRTKNFAIDLPAAQNAIETQSIRVVFVVHPNSPTGNALTQAEIEWLRNLPQNILVVIDEAYFEFSQTTLAGELLDHANWVILRTFSKAFRLAAHRVGYAIAHPEMIAALEKMRLPFNLPSFSIAAARLALSERDLLLAVVAEILEQRAIVYEKLKQLPALQLWQSAANFIYARSSQNLEELTETLRQQGTIIRHTGGGLRITIGTPDENTRMFDRLKALLTE